MATARKNRDIYLLRFIAVASGGYKTDFNLNNIIATLSFYFIVKKWPATVIKVLAAILKTTIKPSDTLTLTHGLAVPYACAQPYHPGTGSHGQLFRPC